MRSSTLSAATVRAACDGLSAKVANLRFKTFASVIRTFYSVKENTSPMLWDGAVERDVICMGKPPHIPRTRLRLKPYRDALRVTVRPPPAPAATGPRGAAQPAGIFLKMPCVVLLF